MNRLSGPAGNGRTLPPLRAALAAAAVLAALLLFIWYFLRIDTSGTTLALDWISIRAGLEHGNLTYAPDNGLRYPPWSAALLLPLGRIPTNAGWGIVAFLTLAVLPFCLPRDSVPGRAWLAGIPLLALSFPAVRTMADGNVEFLILAGIVLLETGLVRKNPILLGLGVLLAATKVQETWILILCLPLWMRGGWTRRKFILALGTAAAVGIPAMLWKGRDWLQSVFTSPYRGSVMDSSLLTTVQRAGLPAAGALAVWLLLLGVTAYLALRFERGFSLEGLGFLLAASLLLAPYAAGNNVLILYAAAIVPLAITRRREGVLLAVLINLPYLLVPFREIQFRYSAGYWTAVLGLAWVLFAVRTRLRCRPLARAADGRPEAETPAAESRIA
jgi:hypothetical protein